MKKMMVLLLLVGVGCANIYQQPFTIKVAYDEFESLTLISGFPNWLHGKYNISIGIYRLEDSLQEHAYALSVYYLGRNWIFIDRGESLVMLIDGERGGFSGEGS